MSKRKHENLKESLERQNNNSKKAQKQATKNDQRLKEVGLDEHDKYGQYINPRRIFTVKSTPLTKEFKRQYVENIFFDPNRNENANYGAVQLISNNENDYNSSRIVANRSKGLEYKNAWHNLPITIYEGNNTDKYGNLSEKSIFDSERVGFLNAYDDFIVKNRANKRLAYDKTRQHNVDNLRRVRSLSPSGKDLGKEDEMNSLMKLSSPIPKYGKKLDKTFANIIKEGLEKRNIKVHMLSERPACDYHDTIGCKQFLPTIMPTGSFYGYTFDNYLNTIDDQRRKFKQSVKDLGKVAKQEFNKKYEEKFGPSLTTKPKTTTIIKLN